MRKGTGDGQCDMRAIRLGLAGKTSHWAQFDTRKGMCGERMASSAVAVVISVALVAVSLIATVIPGRAHQIFVDGAESSTTLLRRRRAGVRVRVSMGLRSTDPDPRRLPVPVHFPRNSEVKGRRRRRGETIDASCGRSFFSFLFTSLHHEYYSPPRPGNEPTDPIRHTTCTPSRLGNGNESNGTGDLDVTMTQRAPLDVPQLDNKPMGSIGRTVYRSAQLKLGVPPLRRDDQPNWTTGQWPRLDVLPETPTHYFDGCRYLRDPIQYNDLTYDRLHREIRHNRAFWLCPFREGPLTFTPTNKYDVIGCCAIEGDADGLSEVGGEHVGSSAVVEEVKERVAGRISDTFRYTCLVNVY
ncbi:hypothetical protein L210DRAFT_3634698 [Boletus edulis BED1]|uniref:Uncharacterized protein n=1 Tax=Boletus edulis BED1 TaxID=1328754 RepID=A0AAD4G8F1_BOLED|nr:hypothetical protein L210DRAFT_3634698 [Boletus edulis BED1]